MTTALECPICMDAIDTCKNCLTTECGHTFHSTCMMKNVSVNGFNCPCCRHEMVEGEKEEGDLWQDGEEEEPIDLLNDDDVLRGFRLFWGQVEPEEIREVEDDIVIPSYAFVAEALKKNNVTYETLVRALLCLDNDLYLSFDGYNDRHAVRFTERVRDLVEEVLGDYTGLEHPDPNSEHSVQEVEWRNATGLGVEGR